MGMRPTIAIVFDGELTDISMYWDWGVSNLLMDAFRIYAHYKDCKTAEEFLARRRSELGEQDPGEALTPDEERELNHRCAMDSEFPLIIDFTQHCIYCARFPRTAEQLRQRPDSRTMMQRLTRRQQHAFKTDFLIDFIAQSVFRMDELNLPEILSLSRTAKGFYRYYW